MQNDRDLHSPEMQQPSDAAAGHRACAPWLVGIAGLALAATALGWAIARMT